jgi:hypothetical protein
MSIVDEISSGRIMGRAKKCLATSLRRIVGFIYGASFPPPITPT